MSLQAQKKSIRVLSKSVKNERICMRYNADMSLSIEEVRKIASLAHLMISDDEAELYRRQLGNILDYASKLRSLDTSSIPPTSTVIPIETVLRSDIPRDSLSTKEALENCAHSERDMYRIPAVFE